ncbi:MAG: hypothetical protein HKN59_03010 [Gammaproteobacteria bacterium]|nr:hypothetical protein [Gammaproteobacteria bacterium]
MLSISMVVIKRFPARLRRIKLAGLTESGIVVIHISLVRGRDVDGRYDAGKRDDRCDYC